MKKILFLALLWSAQLASAQDYYKLGEQVLLFNEVCRNISLMYVDSVDAEKLVTDAIDGMMENLDPYTNFYSASEQDEYMQFMYNKYAGIGSIVRFLRDKKITAIETPMPGSPAELGGLMYGDEILEVDGVDVRGKMPSDVSPKLRGDAGTNVTLKIFRPTTGKTFTKTITRQNIESVTIPTYFMKGETGVILFSEFSDNSADKFQNAFDDLKSQGMKRLIIDLRDNGGGSLGESISMLNMFIPKGELLCKTIGRYEEKEYYAEFAPVDTVMPIAVLVDENTASASEIMAGCLQDLDRATIIGEKTFGKGIVQRVMDLPYETKMKMTISRYYLPSGRCIHSHKYTDGDEEEVPDSLQKTFYTRNGRAVKDASGIMPDVEIKADTISRLLYNLSTNDSTEVMHRYVMNYLTKHKNMAPAETFALTDAEYEDFKKAVLASGFTYTSATSKSLDNLKKMAEAEGYYAKYQNEFQVLEDKLKCDLAYELEYNKSDIKERLELMIILAKYGYKAATDAKFRYDNMFQSALETEF